MLKPLLNGYEIITKNMLSLFFVIEAKDTSAVFKDFREKIWRSQREFVS
jgi:hypothetical protein